MPPNARRPSRPPSRMAVRHDLRYVGHAFGSACGAEERGSAAMPDKDDSSRREKKSETIEARLPFTTKRALLARCRSEGKSVSEVVRLCVENYLASPTQTERRARQIMKVF